MSLTRRTVFLAPFGIAAARAVSFSASACERKIVFVAGEATHGLDAHQYFAGSALLKRALKLAKPSYTVDIIRGWPDQLNILADADAVVFYADGGDGHPLMKHLDQFAEIAATGVGVACLHYALEVPMGKPGNYFLDWIGGYFETGWSVNPSWIAKFDRIVVHPITRGVGPFALEDEWYFHIRFRPRADGVVSLLTAVPPDSAISSQDDPHGGNSFVRAEKGKPQTLAWAVERADGGRGFGLTGGHRHANWQNDDFRRFVLNAIVWIARDEVPVGGIVSARPSNLDLEQNKEGSTPKN